MKTMLVVLGVLLAAGPALAQEDLAVEEEAAAEAPQASAWVWGTVEAVDPQAGTFQVRYLVYETAEEAVKTFSVDEETVFQGVMGLADLGAGMHVTIDYKDRDGRHVADVIEVETGGTP